MNQELQGLRQSLHRKQGIGEEEQRHHDEIHDQLETLHIFQNRTNGRANGGEQDGNEKHEHQRDGQERGVIEPEPHEQTNDENGDSLNQGHGGPAQRPAEDNLQARNRRHQRFLQEPELAIPDDFDSGKHRREKNAHGNDSGSEKLDVIAAAGFGERRTKAKTQSQQEQQRLPERTDDARPRTRIALELPEPKDVDRVQRPLQTLRMMRICSDEEASSSRRVCPVKAMKASSRVLAWAFSFNATGAPWATILP